MHIVLRRSADACLFVLILADHRGGAARRHAVRVVRAGLPLRPRRPSGHSREHEEAREGTAKEGKVAWADRGAPCLLYGAGGYRKIYVQMNAQSARNQSVCVIRSPCCAGQWTSQYACRHL